MSFTQLHLSSCQAQHFLWRVEEGIGYVTLNVPERKNPLTFESYAELRNLFRTLVYDSDIKAIVIDGAGSNFSSGGDVHDIIGPLTRMTMPELLTFTPSRHRPAFAPQRILQFRARHPQRRRESEVEGRQN